MSFGGSVLPRTFLSLFSVEWEDPHRCIGSLARRNHTERGEGRFSGKVRTILQKHNVGEITPIGFPPKHERRTT